MQATQILIVTVTNVIVLGSLCITIGYHVN
jgi:hypothetical protein